MRLHCPFDQEMESIGGIAYDPHAAMLEIRFSGEISFTRSYKIKEKDLGCMHRFNLPFLVLVFTDASTSALSPECRFDIWRFGLPEPGTMALISFVDLVVGANDVILGPEAREHGLFSSIASAVCAALETDSKSYINAHFSRIRRSEKSAAKRFSSGTLDSYLYDLTT